MKNHRKHIISIDSTIKEALIKLNDLGKDAVLFVVNNKNKLMGSLTDGDVRRGLIRGITLDSTLKEVNFRRAKVCSKRRAEY